MTTSSIGPKTAPALALAIAIVSCCGGLQNRACAQSQQLPFRAKQDGTVNYEDLMRMTQRPPARDSITDDELAAIKAEHEVKYDRRFTPTKETALPPRKDLYASSLIVSDGVNHTLLPKQAVIFLPERHRQRIVEEPVGKLVLWPDFQKLNHSWIRPLEVSLDVAKGDKAINEAIRRQFESGFQVVVSVY